MKLDIKVVKKIRGQIIRSLSESGYSVPNHYTLSVATESTPALILRLQNSSKSLAGEIKKALEGLFDSKLKVTQNDGSFRVDFLVAYEKLILDMKNASSELEEEPKVNVPPPLIPVSVSIPAMDAYSTLLLNVTKVLEAFFKGKKISEIDVTIPERKKDSDSVKLIFNEQGMSDFYPFIRDLEKHPDFKSRLAVMNNIIFIMQEEVVYEELTKTKRLIHDFISKLTEKVKHHDITVTLVTPMTIAVTADPVCLQLFVSTQPGAIHLYESTDIEWNPKINRNTIFLEVPVHQMERYAENGVVNAPRYSAEQAFSENGTHKKDIPLVIVSDKSEVQLDKKRGVQPREIGVSLTGAPVYGYIHQSTDYDDFHFLPFNRKINKKHVRSISASIDENGVMGFVTVAITNVIDGVMRKYIVDGQHRFTSFKGKGMPILFTYTYVESKRQLVKLIATLNNTSKSWALRDYLTAWESVDPENYSMIRKHLDTKLQITVLLEAFSSLTRQVASERFIRGVFEVKDREVAEQHIQYLVELKKYLPKSRNLYSALLVVFRQIRDYDNKAMIAALTSGDLFEVSSTETQDAIAKRLKEKYFSLVEAA